MQFFIGVLTGIFFAFSMYVIALGVTDKKARNLPVSHGSVKRVTKNFTIDKNDNPETYYPSTIKDPLLNKK